MISLDLSLPALAIRNRPRGILGLRPLVWLDASDPKTLFQDRSATLPVTESGQPVRLILDKSKGPSHGIETVASGAFATNSGWNKGPGWEITDGKAVAISAPGTSLLSQSNLAIQEGDYCEVVVTVSDHMSGGVYVQQPFDGSAQQIANNNGTFVFRGLAGTADDLQFRSLANTTLKLDDVSVRVISGNHALQQVNEDLRFKLARHPASGWRQNLNGTSNFSGWSFGGTDSSQCTLEVASTKAPDGSTTATRITFSASRQHFNSSTVQLPTGDYVGSAWMKGEAGETIRCRLNGVTEFTHMFSGEWQRVSSSVANGTPTRFTVSTWGSGTTARNLEIWQPQHEAGEEPTPYQNRIDQFNVTEAGQRDIWYFSGDQSGGQVAFSLPDPVPDATEFWVDETGTTIHAVGTIASGIRTLPNVERLYAYGLIPRVLSAAEKGVLQRSLWTRSGGATNEG